MLSKTLVVLAAFCLTGTYGQGYHGHEHGPVDFGGGGDPLGVRPSVQGRRAYGSPLDPRALPGGPLVPHRERHGPLDLLGGPRSGRLGGLDRQARRLRQNDRRLQQNIRRTMRRQRKNERKMNRISQRQLNRQRRPGRGGRRDQIGYAG
ncbi:uncharacterized protein LOC144619904 [Crassostrea virginica]